MTSVLVGEFENRGAAVAGDIAAGIDDPILLSDPLTVHEILQATVADHPDALDVRRIIGFEQTIPLGRRPVPLPEGDRYLGFLLLETGSPGEVESSLRSAHARLRVPIFD